MYTSQESDHPRDRSADEHDVVLGALTTADKQRPIVGRKLSTGRCKASLVLRPASAIDRIKAKVRSPSGVESGHAAPTESMSPKNEHLESVRW